MGQVVRGDAAVDHGALELVAYHYMQAVGKLVRLQAYEGGGGLVYHAVELIAGYAVKQRAEFLLYKGEDEAAELPASADYVLIEAGLALVHRHGRAAAEIRAGQLVAGMQLIQRVAALVYYGIQGGGEIVFIVVCGYTHIVLGKVGGEGMLGLPQYAVIPVDAHHVHEVTRKLLLLCNGEALAKGRVVYPVAMLDDLVHKRYEALFEGIEESIAG